MIKAALDEKNVNKSANEIALECYKPNSSLRLSTNAKKVRKVRGNLPNPKSIPEIELTEEEKINFIDRNDNMILFGDKDLLFLLKESPYLFGDATYSVVPSLFSFILSYLMLYITTLSSLYLIDLLLYITFCFYFIYFII